MCYIAREHKILTRFHHVRCFLYLAYLFACYGFRGALVIEIKEERWNLSYILLFDTVVTLPFKDTY